MVEFGLKLTDNKVEEWAEKYIDYEALKNLLAAAEKAAKVRKELEARNPSLASEIKAAYHADTVVTGKESSDPKLDDISVSQRSWNNHADDDVSLLSGLDGASIIQPNDYGSTGYLSALESNATVGGMKRSGSENSLASYMTNMTKTVSGYFHKHSHEYKLKQAYKFEDDALECFKNRMYDEAQKVNDLYNNVLYEMSTRLELLVENVESSELFETTRIEKNTLETMVRKSMMRMRSSLIPSLRWADDDEGLDEVSEDEMVNLSDSIRRNKKKQAKKVLRESDSVRRAMTDLHRRSKLLGNFAILNSTGFIKIIKKFNKKFSALKGTYADISDGFICGDGKGVRELSENMESLFATWFCDGQVTEAVSVLLPKKGDGLDMDWSQLRLGYRLGMCSILACWVAWDCVWGYVKDGNTTIGGRTAFPVFRACGGLLLVHWFWGISVYVWNRYRINYIYLFDFDPRIVDTPIMIFEDATDETLTFLIIMLVYYKSGAHDIPDLFPPGCYPFMLVLFALKRLFFPLKTRIPLWKTIFKVITAPLNKPTFFQTYTADVFTSMVKVFQDILWTCCFIVSGDFLITERDGYDDELLKNWHKTLWYKDIVIPLICLFPLWIRFNQCLRRYIETGKRNPNLLNAAKYALSQAVTLFGAFHPLYLMHVTQEADITHDDIAVQIANSGEGIFDMFWMGVFMSSSLYSYFWDIRMDWGLGRPKHGFLGPRLMFPKKNMYYLVMIADLFLRFMWVTTLIPPQSGAAFEIPQYLSLVTMSMELFRRTIWGFLRLEHEHRHNTQGFRRVDFVPLHFSTETSHKDKKKEHAGWQVLSEVIAVTLVVLTISAWSVISAQKATVDVSMSRDDL